MDLSKLSDAELSGLQGQLENPLASMSDKDLQDLHGQLSKPAINPALDIAKGIGAGIANIPENAMQAPPLILRALGGLADKTGLFSPEAAAKQEELRRLIDVQPVMENIVPQPEGRWGKLAKSAAEFGLPAAGFRGSIARNVGIGATAGLGSEAAGQATEGTSAELPARLGGALVGGYAGARGMEAAANRIGRAITPKGEQVLNEAENLYKDAYQQATEVKIGENVVANTVGKVKAALSAEPTMREVAAPGVHSILDKVAMSGSGDLGDLVAARKALRDNFLGGPEAKAAGKALDIIEGKIADLSSGVMRKIKDADQNYRAFMTDKELGKKLTIAEMQAAGEHSGLNLGNKIRQKASQAANSTKADRFYTDETIKALNQLNKGTATQNLQRYASNILGGGGGLGAVAAAYAGGQTFGEPSIGLAPLAGLLLRKNYNRLVANQAKNTAAMIRAQSPLAQRMALERSSRLLPSNSSPGQFYNNPNYSLLSSLLPTGVQARKGAAETGLLAAILSSPGAASLLNY